MAANALNPPGTILLVVALTVKIAAKEMQKALDCN